MKEEEYNDGKDMKNENRKDRGIFFLRKVNKKSLKKRMLRKKRGVRAKLRTKNYHREKDV